MRSAHEPLLAPVGSLWVGGGGWVSLGPWCGLVCLALVALGWGRGWRWALGFCDRLHVSCAFCCHYPAACLCCLLAVLWLLSPRLPLPVGVVALVALCVLAGSLLVSLLWRGCGCSCCAAGFFAALAFTLRVCMQVSPCFEICDARPQTDQLTAASAHSPPFPVFVRVFSFVLCVALWCCVCVWLFRGVACCVGSRCGVWGLFCVASLCCMVSLELP